MCGFTVNHPTFVLVRLLAGQFGCQDVIGWWLVQIMCLWEIDGGLEIEAKISAHRNIRTSSKKNKNKNKIKLLKCHGLKIMLFFVE